MEALSIPELNVTCIVRKCSKIASIHLNPCLTICPSIQKKLKNVCVSIVYLSCAFDATLHYFYLFIYIERQIAPLFNITKTVISNYYFVNFAIMIQRLPDNLLVFQYALMIMFSLNKYVFFKLTKKEKNLLNTKKKV